LNVGWDVDKNLGGKTDHELEQPGQKQYQGKKHCQDLGNEGQGHFLNGSNRLKNGDHQAGHQPKPQHGSGQQQSYLHTFNSKIDDKLLVHGLLSSTKAFH
jgi:hypothetical protein